MFERVDRGRLSELLSLCETTELRGEYVLVVAGAGEAAAGEAEAADDEVTEGEVEDEAE
jgi:16S rRNA C1402 (ribose-2'-O) methylase RsmI